MTLPPTALPKFLAFALAGQPEEAKSFAGHMVRRGADLAPLRVQVLGACLPQFHKPILEALPWLAEPLFNPRPETGEPAPIAEGLREMLDRAGIVGLPRKEIDDAAFAALGDDVVTYDQPTGGRPRVMACLREHDIRYNPFARPRP